MSVAEELGLLAPIPKAHAAPSTASKRSAPHSELEPFSTDEYQLMLMEARENAEIGADAFNTETFGVEVVRAGWTFEESLSANARLTSSAPARVPAFASLQKEKQGANKMTSRFRDTSSAGG